VVYCTVASGNRGIALLEAAGVRVEKEQRKCPQPSSPRTKKAKNLTKGLKISSCQEERATLPSKLLLLRDIFVALRTVYRMMKHRNMSTTYDSMKKGVEEASGRRFEVRWMELHFRQGWRVPVHSGSRLII